VDALNDQVPPEAVRATVFQQIPPERLQAQLMEAQQWLSGDPSAVFPLVMKRYSYLRQFAPTLSWSICRSTSSPRAHRPSWTP
jgi:hypothetical protein